MLFINEYHVKLDKNILRKKNDFEKLIEMIKSLKNERNSFKEQLRNLETLLKVLKKFIDKNRTPQEKKSFRELIGLY